MGPISGPQAPASASAGSVSVPVFTDVVSVPVFTDVVSVPVFTDVVSVPVFTGGAHAAEAARRPAPPIPSPDEFISAGLGITSPAKLKTLRGKALASGGMMIPARFSLWHDKFSSKTPLFLRGRAWRGGIGVIQRPPSG